MSAWAATPAWQTVQPISDSTSIANAGSKQAFVFCAQVEPPADVIKSVAVGMLVSATARRASTKGGCMRAGAWVTGPNDRRRRD